MQSRLTGLTAVLGLTFALSSLAAAQEAASGLSIVIDPPALTLEVGQEADLTAKVVDGEGNEVEEQVFFFSRARRSVEVNATGHVKALKPGEFTIIARTPRRQDQRLSATITVTIPHPPITRLEWLEPPAEVYAQTTVPLHWRAVDASGADRGKDDVKIVSETPDVASVDAYGNLTAHRAGSVTLFIRQGELINQWNVNVVANPVAQIDLQLSDARVRTGDVITADVVARNAAGEAVENAPILLSFFGKQDDDLGPPASGQITQEGRFVAERPGMYTLVATSGQHSARASVRVDQRDVAAKIDLVGRGPVGDVHTSDLWVWEGVDGRDYAVTGTWGANGDAIFWDVTNPGSIEQISKVTVDARTVNDVKVSADGRLCVISREGASNRKNGIVLIDVSDPRKPRILSTYTEGLTGGVHNVFIYENHVYALSAGRRYDIINIDDPKNPKTVSNYEVDTPSHSIHDVWVEDGIAYSSNWSNGIHMVDVGNGIAGGSPENPVLIGNYAYPSGWNHAAFPYKDEKTGKFYVIAGDEAFPYGLHVKDKPTYPRGWLHFIDFTDPKNPKEVARYQVPEAGTHNFWVEGDTLYTAYYNGGVRVVDISGDLMGDLYNQGREMAWYLPTDKDGVVPNAPMVWGPQPHKGHLFFSDWNSGLWAVKVTPKDVSQ